MIMPEWSPSMPASRRSVFIVVRLIEVLKKHKRMFLIIYIVFTIENESTAPCRISHLFKWKLCNTPGVDFFKKKLSKNVSQILTSFQFYLGEFKN